MPKWKRLYREPDTETALTLWRSHVTGTLKRARERCGLSQQQLAQAIGLNQDGVKVLENDPSHVPVERLFLALRAVGLELVVRDPHEEKQAVTS